MDKIVISVNAHLLTTAFHIKENVLRKSKFIIPVIHSVLRVLSLGNCFYAACFCELDSSNLTAQSISCKFYLCPNIVHDI